MNHGRPATSTRPTAVDAGKRRHLDGNEQDLEGPFWRGVLAVSPVGGLAGCCRDRPVAPALLQSQPETPYHPEPAL